MKKLFLVLLLSGMTAENVQISPHVFTAGQRDQNQYRVWIYFHSKDESTPINLDTKTIARRNKSARSIHSSFDIPVSEQSISTLENHGIEVIHKSRWLNAVSAFVTKEQIETLKNLPFIWKINPVHRYTRKNIESGIMDDQSSSKSTDEPWYGFSWDQLDQIQVPAVHDSGFTGNDVRILVMDTGFWLDHTAFSRLDLIAQWDVINGDSICANETADETAYGQDRHGTMVLSSMAAYWPDTLIGPAYSAEYLLAKTEMVNAEIQLEEDNYVVGLEWGEANGADVVSTSLGYLDWYTYCDMDGETAVTTQAIDIAASLGVVCVTAMGNEGGYAPPNDPCNDPITYYMIAPADADSVIAVGSVTYFGTLSSFSSHGPTYDGRIKPEVCARGSSTYCVMPHTTGYTTASGTSLATPLVGGVAALVIEAHPDWDAMMVREALMMTATQHDAPDNNFGWGIVQTLDAIEYSTVETDEDDGFVPETFTIQSIYPNPFNAQTTIRLEVKSQTPIRLSLKDVSGQEVSTIFEGNAQSSRPEYYWNGEAVSSGIYFLTLEWDGGRTARKLTVIK